MKSKFAPLAPHWAVALAIGALTVNSVWAKVGSDEADELGKSLTCTGAEKAGTASGVPEFSGKWLGTPPGLDYKLHSGQHPVDPYKDEKPLFTIAAENVSKYAAHLTEGQKAMFAKYPKTYRIPVYTGHRDFRFPDFVCASAKKNATHAEVREDGLGVQGAVKGAIPFPIPKNGLELAFNNLVPFRAVGESVVRDNANVLSNGSVVWGRLDQTNYAPIYSEEEAGQPLEGAMALGITITMLPEREKGSVLVHKEPLDFAKDKRLAWSYDPGTRRVLQVPEYGFDQPMPGSGGKLTLDQDRLFNGSPERYDWKMVGKKEIYVPANAYKFHANTVKYADLLKPGHVNPDYTRYELRRVWVLEATLKEGFRHMFGKRVMFLDEDTNQAVLSDYYDTRNQLWQHALINYYYAFDANTWQAGSSVYYDFNTGGYVAFNLFQERPMGPVLNKGDLKASMFTPEAARKAGH